MKEALIKATTELARVVMLAIIPVFMTGIGENGTFNIDWRVVGAVALLAALRWLDKFIHSWGESEGNRTLMGGLTRF